jgi:SAM-dependent methyltransferase
MGASVNKERFLDAVLGDARRILEIGCGFGTTIASLANGVRTLQGIDIVPKLFAQAAAANPSIRFESCNAVKFDFSGDPFDVIYSIDFLEHLHPDDVPEHFVSVFRSLVPGGRYIVMTPHAFTGPHDLSQFFGKTPDAFHLKEYRFRDLVALGREAGFQRLRSPLLPFRAYGAWPRLEGRMLVPVAYKSLLEPLLLAVPRSRFRALLAHALMLQTVCVVLEKPG